MPQTRRKSIQRRDIVAIVCFVYAVYWAVILWQGLLQGHRNLDDVVDRRNALAALLRYGGRPKLGSQAGLGRGNRRPDFVADRYFLGVRFQLRWRRPLFSVDGVEIFSADRVFVRISRAIGKTAGRPTADVEGQRKIVR